MIYNKSARLPSIFALVNYIVSEQMVTKSVLYDYDFRVLSDFFVNQFESLYDNDILALVLSKDHPNSLWYGFGIGHILSIYTFHTHLILSLHHSKHTPVKLLLGGFTFFLVPDDISLYAVGVLLIKVGAKWMGITTSALETLIISTAFWLSYDFSWIQQLSFWLSGIIILTHIRYQKLHGVFKHMIVSTQIALVLYLYGYTIKFTSMIGAFFLTPVFYEIIFPMLSVGLLLFLINDSLGILLLQPMVLWVKKLALVLEQYVNLQHYHLWPHYSIQVILAIVLNLVHSKYIFLPLCWLLFQFSTDISDQELELHVLDVGHGLSIVMRTKAHTVIYDAGSMSIKRIERKIAQALFQSKTSSIDQIIYSHADYDHISAHQFLMRNYDIKHIYSAEPLLSKNQSLCRRGVAWTYDGVSFAFLHPDESYYKGNTSSCVLYIKTKKNRILLTGDINEKIEQSLISQYPNLRADVLLAAHHGSKHHHLKHG